MKGLLFVAALSKGSETSHEVYSSFLAGACGRSISTLRDSLNFGLLSTSSNFTFHFFTFFQHTSILGRRVQLISEMKQAFLSWQEFYECPEVNYLLDGAFILFTYFRHGSYTSDASLGCLNAGLVRRGDINDSEFTYFFDVDGRWFHAASPG